MIAQLDPFQLPLKGFNLIEASAGTGKTFTIARLYLRFLLEANLTVHQIALLTYTNAATEELRNRIRAMLAQTLRWFNNPQALADKPLCGYLANLPNPDAAKAMLNEALACMDEAEIHSIHGFCMKQLQQYAFETGAGFENTLIQDQSLILESAVQDFWRSHVVAADSEQVGWIVANWPDPASLLQLLKPLLADEDIRLLPEADGDRHPSELHRKAAFITAALECVRASVLQKKRDQQQIYFDDLLARMDEALHGEQGARLAEQLRGQYQVAMIDEFQDTDPRQYRIFRTLYHAQDRCCLYLIGDPKQAIYSFRGGDIFTYMKARRDCQSIGQQHYLNTNWRSRKGLVGAVNKLFGGLPDAFAYAPDIAFHPADANSAADEIMLKLDGVALPSLQFGWLGMTEDNESSRPKGVIGSETAKQELAAICAGRIAQMLGQAGQGSLMLGNRPLRPGDIALLVRKHQDGELIKAALSKVGLNSVALGKGSVLDTDEAQALCIMLDVLLEPANLGLMRTLLATPVFCFSAEDIVLLDQDESSWNALCARFVDYRASWANHGFMAAFQSIMATEDLAARILAKGNGARGLTNLLQLGEMLQAQEVLGSGMEPLRNWLVEQKRLSSQDDEKQLRLETDEDLIKIVTMHKSKGLQYPVVLIPFPWVSSSARDYLELHLDGQRRIIPGKAKDIDIEDADQYIAEAERERQAEDMRLLYVALTRAEQHCFLGWGHINKAYESALGKLLHVEKPSNEQSCLDDILAISSASGGAIQVDLTPERAVLSGRTSESRQPLQAAIFQGKVLRGNQIYSFSSLSRGMDSVRPDHDAVANEQESLVRVGADRPDELPAGANTGSCLHEIFEHIDFPSASGELLDQQVQKSLGRYGMDAAQWGGVVSSLVTAVLDTELDHPSGLKLRNISRSDRLSEFEFHFSVATNDTNTLRDVISHLSIDQHVLNMRPMQGLMRGFIDMVFRHGGKYYLLDYKSNILGNQPHDYGQGNMKASMREHAYDVQYLIYSIALHRYLQQRLNGYRYETHFGGVYYLFLRGMSPGQSTGIWYCKPDFRWLDKLDGILRDVS